MAIERHAEGAQGRNIEATILATALDSYQGGSVLAHLRRSFITDETVIIAAGSIQGKSQNRFFNEIKSAYNLGNHKINEILNQQNHRLVFEDKNRLRGHKNVIIEFAGDAQIDTYELGRGSSINDLQMRSNSLEL